MKKILIFLLCALMTGCTVSQNTQQPDAAATPDVSTEIRKTTYTSFEAGFDTVFYLTFYSSASDETLKGIFDECVELAYSYHQLFDIYHTYEGVNNIKTINDNAGIEPVTVQSDIIEMLVLAKEMNEMSNGEFDVTYGAVLKLWHNWREEAESTGTGPVPDQAQLLEAQKNVGWQHIQIDEENSTVYIDQEGISLDVGGIAKGFTVEKLASFLTSKGIDTAIINFGGNNRVLGTKPDGSAWGLGIEQPGTSSAMVAIKLNGETSAVTSGDYHRYYLSEDGNLYHHIIDPQTLFPSIHFHSVTIYTKDSGYADALSTSLFTMSVEDGQKLLDEFNTLHPDTPASAVWMMDEDKAIDTEYGFYKSGYFVVYSADLEGKIDY